MIFDNRDGIDLEFYMLEQGLRVDAQWVADLIRNGRETEATAYIRDTGFLARQTAWKQGRTP